MLQICYKKTIRERFRQSQNTRKGEMRRTNGKVTQMEKRGRNVGMGEERTKK